MVPACLGRVSPWRSGSRLATGRANPTRSIPLCMVDGRSPTTRSCNLDAKRGAPYDAVRHRVVERLEPHGSIAGSLARRHASESSRRELRCERTETNR